jgi:hypothetical protein
MSLSDKVPFVLNEQYKSEDLNTLQDVAAAWADDAAAFPTATRFTSTPAAAIPADELYPVVLGGLNASPSGGNVSIAPGVAVVPDLGADPNRPISQEVLARNAAAIVVALPSPVTDTWYLITAAAVETSDAAVPRNRWVPANNAWESPVPSIVKRTRMALAFTVAAGSATQIPTSVSRMPICAVFRPAGGGAVTTSQIVDLRPFADGGPKTPAVVLQRNLWRTNLFAASGSTLLAISSRVLGPDGTTMWVEEAGLDPIGAAIKDPSSGAAAAGQWWYLYLCPLPVGGSTRVFPRHAQAGLAGQQGILVLSRALPNGRTNSATVNLPAPFNNFPCAAGKAACIGALKRDSANTGWLGQACTGDLVRVAATTKTVAPVGTATIMTPGGDVDATDVVPLNARACSYKVQMTNIDLAGGAMDAAYARYEISGTPAIGSKFTLSVLAQSGGYTLASNEVLVPNTGVYAIDVRAVVQVAGDAADHAAASLELQINGVTVGIGYNQRASTQTLGFVALNLSGAYPITGGQFVRVRVAAGNNISDILPAASEISISQIDPPTPELVYTLAAGVNVASLSYAMAHRYHTLYAADLPLVYGTPLTIAKGAGWTGTPTLAAVCEAFRF